MAQKKTARKSDTTSTALAVGAGVAGVAAVTAAAYLMFGPDAKKNRRIVRGWAIKMRGDIIEKLENAKEVTEPVYHKIIDEVSDKYAKLKNVDQAELLAIAAEARKHWQHLKRETKQVTKKVTATKKSTPKKATKKSTTKK